MNQYNEISTLQYMGSKTRIISHICEPIIKNKSIKTVVDLFAGTGSVGYALKAHKNIISNDLEYYADVQTVVQNWFLTACFLTGSRSNTIILHSMSVLAKMEKT